MKTFLLLISFIFFMSCQNEKHNTIEPNAFDKQMDSLHSIGAFNGFSATIVDTTGIIYNKGFGLTDIENNKKYTANTIINIASISKVFIGTALLKAKEMEYLELDEPINKYLPFEVFNPNHPEEEITIKHLATHTSSIIDNDIYMNTCYVNKDNIAIADNLKEKYETYYQNPSSDWLSLSDYMQKLLKKNEALYQSSIYSKHLPGEKYEYSNVGAALCALVIENATNQPFNEFTKKHIFEPLKMNSTSWIFEEVDSLNYSKLYYDNQELPYYKILSYPDGGLITSSTELGLYLTELMKGYFGNGAILNTESYNEIFKSQLNQNAFESKKSFNVGVFTEKELAYNVIGHNGGDPGTNTMMYFDTKKGVGKILITNTDSDKKISDDVFWGIWNVLDNY